MPAKLANLNQTICLLRFFVCRSTAVSSVVDGRHTHYSTAAVRAADGRRTVSITPVSVQLQVERPATSARNPPYNTRQTGSVSINTAYGARLYYGYKWLRPTSLQGLCR
ncbi:MAG: hypothetical protein HXL33_04575 [Prevotellaceae bacterium]|nr:hypothetical protein [Prevotellaceae bacterium]